MQRRGLICFFISICFIYLIAFVSAGCVVSYSSGAISCSGIGNDIPQLSDLNLCDTAVDSCFFLTECSCSPGFNIVNKDKPMEFTSCNFSEYSRSSSRDSWAISRRNLPGNISKCPVVDEKSVNLVDCTHIVNDPDAGPYPSLGGPNGDFYVNESDCKAGKYVENYAHHAPDNGPTNAGWHGQGDPATARVCHPVYSNGKYSQCLSEDNGTLVQISKCANSCAKENMIKDPLKLSISLNGKKVDLTYSSSGELDFNAQYSGEIKELVGSKIIILTYNFLSPEITTVQVSIEGSLLNSNELYIYANSCQMKPGIYTLKQVNPKDVTKEIKNGKTMSFEIISNPCPGKCTTDSDCRKDSSEECNKCDVSIGRCYLEKGNPDSCKYCDGTNAVPPVKADGSYCAENNVAGYCKNKVCQPLNCKKAFGEGNIPCPLGKDCPANRKPSPLDCCKPNSNCCYNNKKAEPICCDNNFYSGCQIVSQFGKEANICNLKNCPADRSVKCAPVGDIIKSSFCCREGDSCSSQTTTLDIVVSKISVTMPACVKASCNTASGEFSCGKADKGNICCKKEEKCSDISEGKGYFFACLPSSNSCTSPKFVCEGLTEIKDKVNFCCNPGTICTHSPNGFPDCTPMPEKLSGTGSPLTGNIISPISNNLSVNRQGFYSLREPVNLEENGESYHIYSDNGSLEGAVNFGISNPQDLGLYYYQEGSINECISKIVSSETRNSDRGEKVHIDKVVISCNNVENNQLANNFLISEVLRAGSANHSNPSNPSSAASQKILDWKNNVVSLKDLMIYLKNSFKS